MLLDLRSRRGGGRRRRRRSSSSPAACRRESTRLTAGGEGGGGGDFPRDRDRDRGGDRGGDLGRDRSASSGLLDGWRRGRGTFLSPYLSSLLFKSSTKAFVLTLGGFGGGKGDAGCGAASRRSSAARSPRQNKEDTATQETKSDCRVYCVVLRA